MIIFLLLLFAWRPPDSSPIPSSSRQLVLVLTPAYRTTQGFLFKFQRDKTVSNWQAVESAIPIVIGRAGMGWGEGLHESVPASRPVKREGDGRSPAGIFNLSAAFGFPARQELEPLHFPYLQITAALECVDDSASEHYNTLVDRQKLGASAWHSSEKMIQAKIEYHLGVFVDHNLDLRRPGFGSCIFLHVWSAPENPTIGCTAMAGNEMEKIIKWLDAKAAPVLVQLPLEEYARLRSAWQLPEAAWPEKSVK